MYVMTKAEAQVWLNRPENAGIEYIDPYCFEQGRLAMAWSYDKKSILLWFSVQGQAKIYRKALWHWPKPDESTPIDAKVWCTHSGCVGWAKRHYYKNNLCFYEGYSSWTTDKTSPWEKIVLANPDDLDEMPPMDLEV